jgi:flagellar protein FlgJ
MGIIITIAIIALVVFLIFRGKGSKKPDTIPAFETPKDFIEWFEKKVAFMKDLNFDTRAVIAHAALETGWGKHLPTDMNSGRVSLNFFGIKWYPGWPSDYVTCLTKEYDPNTGEYYNTTADFRAYKTIKEGLEDYVSLVKRKYPKAWENRSNYEQYIKEIAWGGWCPTPTYVNSILSIIEKYLL